MNNSKDFIEDQLLPYLQFMFERIEADGKDSTGDDQTLKAGMCTALEGVIGFINDNKDKWS